MDTRTALLMSILNKKSLTQKDLLPLIRELVNVNLSMSVELGSLHRTVRGYNGDRGLLGQLDDVEKKTQDVIKDLETFMAESRAARQEREQKEKDAGDQPLTMNAVLRVAWADFIRPVILAAILYGLFTLIPQMQRLLGSQ